MPNYGTYAICPYYQSEDPLRIKCEGLVKLNRAETENVIHFPSSKNKNEWIAKYCESREYLLCPYASVIESSYDDTGENVRLLIRTPVHIEIRETSIKAKPKKYKGIKGQLSFRFVKEKKS